MKTEEQREKEMMKKVWKTSNGKELEIDIDDFTDNIDTEPKEWRDYVYPSGPEGWKEDPVITKYTDFSIKTFGCGCCNEDYLLDKESYIDFLKQYRAEINKALKILTT